MPVLSINEDQGLDDFTDDLVDRDLPNSNNDKKERLDTLVDYTDFKSAITTYNRLISGFDEIRAQQERNRAMRYAKDVKSETLRANGILKEDEIYNPLRIIDTNIRREQPRYTQYLTQSRRSIVFESPTNEATINGIEGLEADFTKKARYPGWEIPFIRSTDGAQCHGWDFAETVFDEDFPGHFCFSHTGRDNLIFNNLSEDIENQECVLRRERLTSSQLKRFIRDNNWRKEVVDKLLQTGSAKGGNSDGTEETVFDIYKCFYKIKGIVHYSWFATEGEDYLVDPVPLWLGIKDVMGEKVSVAPAINNADDIQQDQDQPTLDWNKIYETKYPFIIQKYFESEDPVILNLRGRADFDESAQEGASAISSSLINGSLRASHIFGSPASTPYNATPNSAPKQLQIAISNGAILDQPMNWSHLPYPDAGMLQIMQSIVTQNLQESSSPDFAVINRKDSGKTATEIDAATRMSTELTGVQIILLSIFIRECYSRAWRIYQNRVLQGEIEVTKTLLPLFGTYQPVTEQVTGLTGQVVERPAIDPLTGEPQTQLVEVKLYIIKSSGDIDVIQREATANKRKAAWPIIATTALAPEFLKDILRADFPEDAERYIAFLDSAAANGIQSLTNTIMQLSNVIKSLVVDPATGNIKPEYANSAGQLQQLQQTVTQQVAQISGSQPQQTNNSQSPNPKAAAPIK